MGVGLVAKIFGPWARLARMSAPAIATPGVPGLAVRLDAELPMEVGAGRRTALVVCGSCFNRDSELGVLNMVDGHG